MTQSSVDGSGDSTASLLRSRSRYVPARASCDASGNVNASAHYVLFVIALVMAMMFQGSRGLWDPDEGRYTNVALQMIASGDYLTPHRNDESIHVSKPPATYWSIAASVQVFGKSELAMRLPMALAFALTVLMVGLLGRVLVPNRPWLPALIYMSSPLPFLASNIVTTDTLLTCCETAAMVGYVRWRFAGGSARWVDLMWASFGLAFMVKGPPSLLPLLAIVAFEFRGRLGAIFSRPLGLALFAAIGLSWYGWIIGQRPELLSHFIGHEVFDRVASAKHDRNSEWYGGLLVYLPTLLLGALPWTVLAMWRRWLQPKSPESPLHGRFVSLWLGVPLLVFFLASSRLPLYVLPLFVPLSLLLAHSLQSIQLRSRLWVFVAGLVVLLVSIKGFVAQAPSHQDARSLATDAHLLLPTPASELVFVETTPRFGLRYYLGAQIRKVSLQSPTTPRNPSDSFDGDLHSQLMRGNPGAFYLMPQSKTPRFIDSVRELGLLSRRLGQVDELIVFAVQDPS